MKPWRNPKAIGLVLLLVVALGLILVLPRGSTVFPVPKPNGYDDFLQAAAAMRGGPLDDGSEQAARALAAMSAEPNALVQAGLHKPCRVRIEVSEEYLDSHQKNLAELKGLTRCLIARGKVAHLEGRTDEAFQSYAEAYQFAHEIGRGGLAMDYLIHLSCKMVVLEQFKPIIPSLSGPQCREMLAMIDRIEKEEEDPGVVARRLARWQSATFGKTVRLEIWAAKVKQAIRTFSLKPFRSLRSELAEAERGHQNRVVGPVSAALRTRLEPVATPQH